MNQFGFVEISIIKNDKPYRALLPLGTPWRDAHDALLEMAAEVAEHIRVSEDNAAKAESEKKGE